MHDRRQADPPYHQGELRVQSRFGVAGEAQALSGLASQALIPPRAVPFLESQRVVVAATLGASARRGAWLVWDLEPVLQVMDAGEVVLRASPTVLRPVVEDVRATGRLGLLAIDLNSRRRMKLKGTASFEGGAVRLVVERAYALCPKYIQRRALSRDSASGATEPEVTINERLSERQRRIVDAADTFFIATFHPASGSDASHRGGMPGFVRAVSGSTIEFHDYPGNNMFNTLGNLEIDAGISLLFPDFRVGSTLHLSGSASVVSSDASSGSRPSVRLVRMSIERVEERSALGGPAGPLLEYSSWNPPSNAAA
jgi:predicted pyridoxine 5'-phosphate oxidase superfamily flavin-nucleotide-binding protein